MEKYVLYHHGIKGQRKGVRRFQNPDGTLTEAGKRRYARDTRDMSDSKKKKYQPDVDKWVREDIGSAKTIANEASNLTGKLNSLNSHTTSRKTKPRMNLDKMSDQEMRSKINRELLERQYNDVFNPATTSKGRERLSKTLTVAGDVLAATGTALGIALAIKELRS